MRKFGLIGYPLTHSFSKKYFTEKFGKEQIIDCLYDLYEMEEVQDLLQIVSNNKNLEGINVTIPHKKSVMALLDSLDASALNVGAVNVIKIENGELRGYNSDYYGFLESLKRFVGKDLFGIKAIILGTGGAASAVKAALKDLNIPFINVSRNTSKNAITYEDLCSEKLVESHRLIINTTPLGMFPAVSTCPSLPYDQIGPEHYLYDLVYNPIETLFLRKGKLAGAATRSGLEMLHLQAEKAWEIWNSEV